MSSPETPTTAPTAAPALGTARVKRGMAEMLKGGVIMDVVTPEQAKIAEDAGAVAVMALERVPADIRAEGGVARMADPAKVQEIVDALSRLSPNAARRATKLMSGVVRSVAR